MSKSIDHYLDFNTEFLIDDFVKAKYWLFLNNNEKIITGLLDEDKQPEEVNLNFYKELNYLVSSEITDSGILNKTIDLSLLTDVDTSSLDIDQKPFFSPIIGIHLFRLKFPKEYSKGIPIKNKFINDIQVSNIYCSNFANDLIDYVINSKGKDSFDKLFETKKRIGDRGQSVFLLKIS